MSRALSSNSVVLNDQIIPATIIFSIESGKILEICYNKILTTDDPLLSLYDVDPKDYRNVSPLIIMPGLVDAHVHLNEPGRTEWEGFETGTKAAASGGVTTVIDMPLNAIPPTTSVKNFNIKLEAAKGQCWVDVGFWGGLVPDNLKDLIPLINAGVRGFKGFLIDSGVDEFPAIDSNYIDKALEVVKNHDTLIMFHAEMQPRNHDHHGPQVIEDLNTLSLDYIDNNNNNDAIVELENTGSNTIQTTISSKSNKTLPLDRTEHDYINKDLSDDQIIALATSPVLQPAEPKSGEAYDIIHRNHSHTKNPLQNATELSDELNKVDPTLYTSFLASRPDIFEIEAVKTIISCALKNPSVPLHIVHLATKDVIPILYEAQKSGLKITAETCFHYLSFFAENIPDGSTFFKCCPPIRTNENRLKLWDGLKKNIITTVVSDHSPCTPELKNLTEGDFFSAWGGIASVGLGLQVLYTESLKDETTASIVDIVNWCCKNTAKQVGLNHRKGDLKVGYDADIVIFDTNAKHTITNESVFFKNKITAYNGVTLNGRVIETIVRGNSIFALNKGHSTIAMGKAILEKRVLVH
ncbi:hypothetical protein WICMUC_001587 [Wickerhamomyces mucosus]|uniref:Amidohydrolase-related domain-containing protein n=1 Tax=Wickerhamomyces mucosus TaxID=1378264 RepID=A0A9P8TH90_9ASCO|nr:hypothetical protein WICMUC_001587 [Wickerhamomyces mucosus]